MSVRLMAIVWELDLPPGEKLVLLALADQANDTGTQCWPSVETIARRSGQGVRTVRRALASLDDAGHLTRNHREGTSTQYRIHPCQNGSPAELAPLPKTTEAPAKLAPKPSRTIKQQSQRAKHVIPANWEPEPFGEGTESRKAVDGWPPGKLKVQAERFAAHHRAAGSKFSNWQAAWSKWVLNDKEFSNGNNFRRSGGAGPDRRSGLARAIDAELQRVSPFP